MQKNTLNPLVNLQIAHWLLKLPRSPCTSQTLGVSHHILDRSLLILVLQWLLTTALLLRSSRIFLNTFEDAAALGVQCVHDVRVLLGEKIVYNRLRGVSVLLPFEDTLFDGPEVLSGDVVSESFVGVVGAFVEICWSHKSFELFSLVSIICIFFWTCNKKIYVYKILLVYLYWPETSEMF